MFGKAERIILERNKKGDETKDKNKKRRGECPEIEARSRSTSVVDKDYFAPACNVKKNR